MSWQKCVAGESYSLAVPPPVVVSLTVVHLISAVSTLAVTLPAELTVLLWLVVFRSWRHTRGYVAANARRVVLWDQKGRITLHERPRSLVSHNIASEDQEGLHRRRAEISKTRSDQYENLSQIMRPACCDAGPLHYTCCRSVRVPGCIAMTLTSDYGKPLEILVFYRYHQREFYRRLVRHLSYR